MKGNTFRWIKTNTGKYIGDFQNVLFHFIWVHLNQIWHQTSFTLGGFPIIKLKENPPIFPLQEETII